MSYGLKGRPPTRAEQRYLDKAARIGCVICLLFKKIYSPAVIHHTDGKTKIDAHFKIFPLCPNHHTSERDDEELTSRHSFKRRFEHRYASERELILVTKTLVFIDFDGSCIDINRRRDILENLPNYVDKGLAA